MCVCVSAYVLACTNINSMYYSFERFWYNKCGDHSTVFVVSTEDFDSRFQFNNAIPPPEIWKAGPKTYPSMAAQNRQRGGGGGGGGEIHVVPCVCVCGGGGGRGGIDAWTI